MGAGPIELTGKANKKQRKTRHEHMIVGKREPTNLYHERSVSNAQVLEPKWHSTGHAHRSKFVLMTSKLDMQQKMAGVPPCFLYLLR